MPRAKSRTRTTKKAELPGGRRTVQETVVSPYGNGFDKVRRVIDTIDAMRARKQLTPEQFEAASRYRWAFHAAHGAIPSCLAIEPLGSRAAGPRTPSPAPMRAAELLREVRVLLGVVDHTVIRIVCGEGGSLLDAAVRLHGVGPDGQPKRPDLDDTGRRLRTALSVLAVRWYGPPITRAGERCWVPEWARPGVLARWGEIEPGRVAVG